jgi:hypothetical protein
MCNKDFNDYAKTSNPSQNQKNNRIKKLLSDVSFWRITILTDETGLVTLPLDKERTEIRFCMVNPEMFKKYKNFTNVIMYSAGPFIGSDKVKFYAISGNQNEFFNFDSLPLASSLIHEIVHLIHRIDNPNIIKDDEFESWKIQVEVLKAQLSPINRTLYETKLKEQKQKPYNWNKLKADNNAWVYAIFGSTRFYLDKFAFDAYGMQTLRE